MAHGWRCSWPGPYVVTDRESKTPLPPAETLAIVRRAVSNGVLLIRAGLFSNCIRFLPPLNMPEDMLREGLYAVGRAIEAVIPADQMHRMWNSRRRTRINADRTNS
jgi:hypothetical protein